MPLTFVLWLVPRSKKIRSKKGFLRCAPKAAPTGSGYSYDTCVAVRSGNFYLPLCHHDTSTAAVPAVYWYTVPVHYCTTRYLTIPSCILILSLLADRPSLGELEQGLLWATCLVSATCCAVVRPCRPKNCPAFVRG